MHPYELHRGTEPLLVSIPHLGGSLPDEILPMLTDEARVLRDTDWHLDRLYAFALARGYSVLKATHSRYAIDINRPPDGRSLYPGQTTTGLCPTETFRGEPLYRPGCEPDADEIARRVAAYWQPYHDALAQEIERLRARHGHVLLWEAHSIASVLPRLFEGRLPDLNFGTNSGASCAPAVIQAVWDTLPGSGSGSGSGSSNVTGTGTGANAPADAAFTRVLNGRFKGGYITRQYGDPSRSVHAIQLEMSQCVYMEETEPFAYRPERAARIQPLLDAMLGNALSAMRNLTGTGGSPAPSD